MIVSQLVSSRSTEKIFLNQNKSRESAGHKLSPFSGCARKGLLGFIRTFFCWQKKVEVVIGRVKQTNGKLYFLTLVFWSILDLFCVLFGEQESKTLKVNTWSREEDFWIIFEESTVDWTKVCWVTCFIIDCFAKGPGKRIKKVSVKKLSEKSSQSYAMKKFKESRSQKTSHDTNFNYSRKKNPPTLFEQLFSFSLKKPHEMKITLV